jgi:hypothetical protein
MQRSIFAAALALTLTTAAVAQPAPDPGAGGGPRGRLFISPAGEPFRGGDGLATWFAGADADHDGALSPAEFAADAQRFFKTIDADHNGVLDGPEVQVYEQKVVPEINNMSLGGGAGPGAAAGGGGGRSGRGGGGRGGGGRGGGMGGGGMGGGGGGGGRGGGGRGGGGGGGGSGASHAQVIGAGREGAARFSLLNEPEPLTGADTDIDGKVTVAEWTRATTRRFDRLDKAQAGKLTLDGLQTPAAK